MKKHGANNENIGDQIADIGTLDERIELIALSEGRNEYGEETNAETTAATVWARVEYKTTSTIELQLAGQETVKNRIIFTIRYWPGLHEKMKIKHKNTAHDIVAIATIGRNVYHKITTIKYK